VTSSTKTAKFCSLLAVTLPPLVPVTLLPPVLPPVPVTLMSPVRVRVLSLCVLLILC
jgi:hypothetical protein